MNQDQLQNLIDEIGAAKLEQALKKRNSNTLSNHNVFNDVSISYSDRLSKINTSHYKFEEGYRRYETISRHLNPKSQYSIKDGEYGYHKIRNSVHSTEIHHIIRDLVMSLLGEKNGKNLEQDELKFSKEAYSQFKQLYLDLCEKRFDELGTN
ncbi:hypothetical protein JIO05_02995 [Pediococcus acidilactici]|uniref:hypothetical protein n=1 Tax=Pediococcus acidilactici TaxID=1254 RepID=UPI0019123BCB|nr:hypothetical protein [Pediococcus acidilactici]QQP83893.1 hypothetical protein JIO05_02995 [Pediococcus acidilactici]